MAMTAADYQKNVASLAIENAYQASSAVQDANATLAEVNAGKPTSYTSQDADRIGNLYQQIISQGAYSYDPAKDATYQAYKNDYQAMGQQAAQQTRQTINGMNGGYGNTWSGAVSGQQYGAHLQAMNDILPELESNAYKAYTSESDRLNNLYSLAQTRDDTAYGRYRDQVSDWQADRDFAATQADTAYSRDYQNYSDAMNNALTYTGWEREDATTAQSNAYDWALQLIQQGILPNADILSTAGISSADALELAKKYGYKVSSGGSGGSSSKKSSSGSSSTSSSTGGSTALGILFSKFK